MAGPMAIRREMLVFIILGACAWFIGLGVGEALKRSEAEADRPKADQVKEHDPPAAFDIRRAA